MNKIQNKGFKLDHIGIAVKDIKLVTSFYESFFNIESQRVDIVIDELQKVKVAFIEIGDIRLELVEPISSDSSVMSFINRNVNLYHICFQVSDIDNVLENVRELGGVVTVPPVPAKAFNNNKIAFIYFKNLGLVELLQVNNL